MKKTLKLNIQTEDIDEDDTNSNDNTSYPQIKDDYKEDYNRGKKNLERPKSQNTNEIELIKYYLSSSNKDFDFSFHWYEKCSNLNEISELIKINLNDPNFKEHIRDYACEFELLKLITEDNYHKENLIELPKSIKRLNRYHDIIPCKNLNYFLDKFNAVFLKENNNNNINEEYLKNNYINASYIDVSKFY